MKLPTLAFLLITPFMTTACVADDWVDLIQGDSLEGWEKLGGEASYVNKDGVITGTTGPGKNTFLTRGPYGDFELGV